MDERALLSENWELTSNHEQIILEKLRRKGNPLGDYVDNQIYRGLLTGLNEAFIIDKLVYEYQVTKDENVRDIIKPFLMGRDVHEYSLNSQQNKYLICMPKGFTNSRKSKDDNAWDWINITYPTLAKYLGTFAEKAQKRLDKGDYWWEFKSLRLL